jgi:WD40 repeat protein
MLEGNLGILPSSKNGPVPEITSMVMVNDCMETNHFSRGFVESTPKSRIFFGTSVGSVFIWQQSEDDQFRSSLEKVNNGGIAGAAPIMAWQPRGKLLSVVMELHDSSIIDMDYIRVPPPESEHATPPQQQSRVGVVENYTERIITSSADGIVNVWLLNRHETSNALPLDHLGYLELNKEYARSTSWDPTGSAAILGTAENSVLLLNYEEEHVAPEKTGKARKVTTEDLIRPKIAIDVVTQSHNGKVRKVAVNSVIPSIVATISSEKVVRVWDLRERTLLSSFELAEPATAVAFTPDGGEIMLGTEKGDLLVYTCRALRELAQSFPCAFMANDFSEAEWNLSFRRSLASKNSTCCYDSISPRTAACCRPVTPRAS